MKNLIIATILTIVTSLTFGAQRYFVNGGIDNNWGSTSNWSLTSGGAGGQTVPTASDDVFFDVNSPNCIVNSSSRVARTLNFTGYTNTLTMSNGITVSGNISLATNMLVSGSSALTVNSSATLTSNGKTWPNGLNFNGTSQIYTLADNWTIGGTLTFSGNTTTTLNGFTLNAGGNLTVAGTGYVTGSTLIVMNGTGAWSTTGTWLYNNLTFNTTGAITISGTVRYGVRTLTYVSGTMITTGSTLWLSSATMTLNTSGMTWNSIASNSSTGITLASDLYYSGLWTLTNTTKVNSNNIYHTGATGGFSLGTNTFYFTGTTTLNLVGSGVVNANNGGAIGTNITINTSGTYTFNGNLTYQTGLLTHIAGTVITTNHNLTLTPPVSMNTTGINWGNVTCHEGSTSSNLSITPGSVLKVNGTLTYSGSYNINFNGGTIDAYGNISITNTSTNGSAGTGTLNIAGSGNQTFTGTSVAGTGRLPNITINKPSGTLTLANAITCYGDWTYIAGNVDPSSSTVQFSSVGTKNIDGEGASSIMAFNNVHISNTRTLTGNLIANGNIQINALGTLTQNSKTINVGGNWLNNGTYSTSTQFVTFFGPANSTLTKTGGETFSKLAINKSGGSLTLNNPVTINNTLDLINGNILSTSTNYVMLIDNAIIIGGSANSFVEGYMKKAGNDAFVFPIGKGAGNYHPLGMTAPQAPDDVFFAEYFNSGQTFGSTTDGTFSNLSTCEYWNFDGEDASSQVSVTLNWNANSCQIAPDINKMIVTRWDGSQWENLQNGGVTGSTTVGSVSTAASISTFGTFTTAQLPTSVNFTFRNSFSGCGLEYKQSTVSMNKRIHGLVPKGQFSQQPAYFSFAGIPIGAQLEAAYVYFTMKGNNLPLNINYTFYAPSVGNSPVTATRSGLTPQMGGLGGTCWGIGETGSYFTDVTSLLSTLSDLNLAYYITGLPASFPAFPYTDIDGASLLLVYTAPCQSTRPSTLVLWDGLATMNGGGTLLVGGGTGWQNPYSNNVNSRGFFIISDVECGSNSNPAFPQCAGTVNYTMNTNNYNNSVPVQGQVMYNFVDNPIAPPLQSPSSTPYYFHSNNQECFDVSVIGMYTQDGDSACMPLTIDYGPNITFCEGQRIHITPLSILGGTPPYSYSWSPGGQVTPYISVSPPVFQNYIVTVTDANGCTATDVIGVNPLPKPMADAGPVSITTCRDNITPNSLNMVYPLIIGTNLGYSGYTYSWTPTVGLSCYNCAQPKIDAPNPSGFVTENYMVTVTDANGCTAFDQISVTLNPKEYQLQSHNNLWGEAGNATSVVCPNDQVVIGTFGTINNLSFLWYPSTNPSNSQQTVATPFVPTNYILYSTETITGCSYSDEVFVNITYAQPCRIGEFQQSESDVSGKGEWGIEIYPNPNSGSFNIDYSLETGSVGYFELYDISGRMFGRYPMPEGENTLNIIEQKLTAGVFFYKVIVNENLVKADKIVVVK